MRDPRQDEIDRDGYELFGNENEDDEVTYIDFEYKPSEYEFEPSLIKAKMSGPYLVITDDTNTITMIL